MNQRFGDTMEFMMLKPARPLWVAIGSDFPFHAWLAFSRRFCPYLGDPVCPSWPGD
jgi:hypothetical protein